MNTWSKTDPSASIPPAEFEQAVESAGEGDQLRLLIEGPDFNTGNTAQVTLPLDIAGGTLQERLDASGLLLFAEGDIVRMDEPMFGTETAEKLANFDFYADAPVTLAAIEAPQDRMPAQVFYLPALVLLGLVILLQRRRQTKPAF